MGTKGGDKSQRIGIGSCLAQCGTRPQAEIAILKRARGAAATTSNNLEVPPPLAPLPPPKKGQILFREDDA